ncbi:30S ribosomal protein S1 [Clostridium sp. MB40-C1]|uniref:30S ribosomal protein S1 n=1 Tax=Clostridium sp. MB40-C1 TaxID=3070996 RepID=UPI0027E0492B|nr:30S ribosomal protein S1 [Clostridium sp. MB40-C1]WMJ80594.1 30S ribosomal protein S1 [Clostridium sp. MB40-C1]
MTNNNLEEKSMSQIMDEIDESMKPIYSGDLIDGEVISITDSEVLVNIGYITDGIIKKTDVCDEEANLKEFFKPGDKIKVYVVKLNDGEGNVVLSKKKADEIIVWNELKKLFNEGATLEVKVHEIVKGGAVAYFKGVRAFIPASHISNSFVKNLSDYINKTLKVKIIEFDKDRNKVVLSRKEVEKAEIEIKKKDLWQSLKKGEKRTGIVRRLVKFGAFVDLGGMDGLIHNSDLSWKRVNDPSEVVSIGDKVEVYVLDFNKENGKISLGLKEVEEDPWNNVKYKVQDIVEGKVVRLLDFGAVIEMEDGLEGLVHISEISEENIVKPSQILNIGDKVKVKILDIKEDERKMSLSIKDVSKGSLEDYDKYNDNDEGNFIFAELLKNFKDNK